MPQLCSIDSKWRRSYPPLIVATLGARLFGDRDTLVLYRTWLKQGWPTSQRTRPQPEFLVRCRLPAEAPHLIDVVPA
jgi:hypothetical protein